MNKTNPITSKSFSYVRHKINLLLFFLFVAIAVEYAQQDSLCAKTDVHKEILLNNIILAAVLEFILLLNDARGAAWCRGKEQ